MSNSSKDLFRDDECNRNIQYNHDKWNTLRKHLIILYNVYNFQNVRTSSDRKISVRKFHAKVIDRVTRNDLIDISLILYVYNRINYILVDVTMKVVLVLGAKMRYRFFFCVFCHTDYSIVYHMIVECARVCTRFIVCKSISKLYSSNRTIKKSRDGWSSNVDTDYTVRCCVTTCAFPQENVCTCVCNGKRKKTQKKKLLINNKEKPLEMINLTKFT